MASFIQGLTDVNANSTLYTPDYAFLRYNLDKRTQNYEQGLSQVSSAYNFLNSELSNPLNAQKRDQYLKNAQQQLQQISQSDLSLPENVSAAQGVFQPLATDKAFLYDATATAANKKELSQMESWRTSDNMNERKKFNIDIYNWVKRDINSIKTDTTGDVKNYKFEGRKSSAYVDPQEIVEKAAKDMGVKFEDDIDGGTYVYTVEGGEMHRQKYEAFAKEILQNNPIIQQQNAILGQSRAESLIELAKMHPENVGKSIDQIRYEYGVKHWNDARQTKVDYVNTLGKTTDAKKDELNTAIAILANTPKGGAEEMLAKQKVDALRNEFSNLSVQYQESLKNIGMQFGLDGDPEIAKKREKYATSFRDNAEQLFAQEFQDDAINRFANIRSSFGSKKIKENQAYFKAYDVLNNSIKNLNNLLLQSRGLDIKQEGVDIKQQHEDFIEDLTTGKINAGTSGVGGSGGTKGGGKNEVSSSYAGVSGTQISIATSLENLKTKLTTSLGGALTSLVGGPGSGEGALGILPALGINEKYIPTLRQYFSKALSAKHTDGHDIIITNQEAEALNAMNIGLRSYAKQTGNAELLSQIDSDWGKSLGGSDWNKMLDLCISKLKSSEENWKYIKQYNEHKSLMNQTLELGTMVNTAEKAVVSQLAKEIKTRPELANFLTNNNTKLMDQSTVEGWLRKNKKEIEQFNGGKELTEATIKNIAGSFIANKLEVSTSSSIGDDSFGITGGDQAWQHVKFGKEELDLPISTLKVTPKAYAKLKDEIGTRYPIPGISNDILQQGAMASAIFNIRGKDKEELLSDLVPITQANSEIWQYKDGTDKPDPIKPEDAQNIRRILANYKDNVAQEGVKVYPKSSANNGLAVEIIIDSKDKEDKKYNGRYLFPINVGEGSPEIFKIYNEVNRVDKYSRIKDAETSEPKTIFDYSNMGIKVEIQPSMKGADYGTYMLNVQKQDPVTKQFLPDFTRLKYDYDFTKESYEEFENRVSSLIDQYVMNRIQLEKQQSGGTVTPVFQPVTFNYTPIK